LRAERLLPRLFLLALAGLLALAAWQESPLFDARERAVLALTDEVTLIADKGLTAQTYEAALA